MQMQGVYYKRNDVEDAREQVGVLAQDMEASFTRSCSYGG